MIGPKILAQNKPLSVAAKAAFAYLPEAELANAKLTYEGNSFNSFGELGEDAYLQRFYPNFDSLISSKSFEMWAEVLYLPMLLQIMKVAQ